MQSSKILFLIPLYSLTLFTTFAYGASEKLKSKLDTAIPEERFLAQLKILEARDTLKATNATTATPGTWSDTGAALIHYLSKNYTYKGRLEYVTDKDNPHFLRAVAEYIIENKTSLESTVGGMTFKQQLERAVERSTKAQLEIITTLEKTGERGAPTAEGAEVMLRALDSCYLALPDMSLIMAKRYLERYTDTFGEKSLFNEHIMKELQFLPKLLESEKLLEEQKLLEEKKISAEESTFKKEKILALKKLLEEKKLDDELRLLSELKLIKDEE